MYLPQFIIFLVKTVCKQSFKDASVTSFRNCMKHYVFAKTLTSPVLIRYCFYFINKLNLFYFCRL